jgi:hypothetical protein
VIRLLLVVLCVVAFAVAALVAGYRQTAEAHAACIAAGGAPVYDHDGFRCMRAGKQIEVSP